MTYDARGEYVSGADRLNPRDLPLMRRRSLEHRRLAPDAYIHANKMSTFGRPVDEDKARAMLALDRELLRDAVLYHVSDEMSRLSMLAADSLEDFSIRASDAPSLTGLMWFDDPIQVQSRPEALADPRATIPPVIRYSAIGWRGATITNSDALFSVICYTNVDGVLINDSELLLGTGRSRLNPSELSRYSATLTLLSAWLLMSQRVADVVDTAAPILPRGNQGRRGEKRRPSETVRVVRIAPSSEHPTPAPSDGREYSHRWLVRGHWRKQWYPKQKRNIPIWIQPYAKGPEGKPFLPKPEVVYQWK